MIGNITRGRNEIFKIRLNQCHIWDFQLSNINIDLQSCTDVTPDYISQMSVTGVTQICSSRKWYDAISFNKDLCDIGLTGYDNRFVPNITGEIYNPSGDTTFCLTRVSGDNYCYEMYPSSGAVESTELCGGFFQGFYELSGYNYGVMPNVYPSGWTTEIWFNKHDCVYPDSCLDKPRLNDVYPDNKGFIYFWGLRAENKFCNLFSGETGVTTCTGIPLSPQYTYSSSADTLNPFLYWTRKRLCELSQGEPLKTASLPDCCEGILDNVFGVRLTDELQLDVRIITTSGDCIITGTSKIPNYSAVTVVQDILSPPNSFKENEWNLLTMRYKPYGTPPNCRIVDREKRGTLDLFINGFLKLSIPNFKNFIPYALEEHPDKQLGVPYNISLGGGTQGLLESGDIGGVDLGLPTDEFTICDYEITLSDTYIATGVTVNGVLYDFPPVSISDIDVIIEILKFLVPRQGDVIKRYEQLCDNKMWHIFIYGALQSVDSMSFTNGQTIVFCKNRCIKVLPHLGACGLIEENYAGTFIGSISKFRQYERPLCLSEIRCNFDVEKNTYRPK